MPPEKVRGQVVDPPVLDLDALEPVAGGARMVP